MEDRFYELIAAMFIAWLTMTICQGFYRYSRLTTEQRKKETEEYWDEI